jgi:hypothetical protein
MNLISRADIEEALYEANLDTEALYEGYSGRGMYGKECFGIVGTPGDAMAFLVALAKVDALDVDVIYMAKYTSMDNLGLKTISYWPGYTIDDENDD